MGHNVFGVIISTEPQEEKKVFGGVTIHALTIFAIQRECREIGGQEIIAFRTDPEQTAA